MKRTCLQSTLARRLALAACAALVFLLPHGARAEDAELEWARQITIDARSSWPIRSYIAPSNNLVVLLAYTNNPGPIGAKVISWTPSGDVAWNLDFEMSFYPSASCVDPLGNLYFTDYQSRSKRLDIVKVRPNGTVAWHRQHTMQRETKPWGISANALGEVALACEYWDPRGPGCVLRLNTDGSIRWLREYSMIGDGPGDMGTDIAMDAAGKTVVTFNRYLGNQVWKSAIRSLDRDGNVLHEVLLLTPYYNEVKQGTAGSFWLGGHDTTDFYSELKSDNTFGFRRDLPEKTSVIHVDRLVRTSDGGAWVARYDGGAKLTRFTRMDVAGNVVSDFGYAGGLQSYSTAVPCANDRVAIAGSAVVEGRVVPMIVLLNSNGSEVWSYRWPHEFLGARALSLTGTVGGPLYATCTVSTNPEQSYLEHEIVVLKLATNGNQVPEANDDAYATNMNQALNVGAPGVLANDTDPEGNALTAELADNAQHGTLTLNSNGSFAYTPSDGFTGEDAFTYRAKDAGGSSNVATVTITVGGGNQAPTANNDAYSVPEDETLGVDAPGVLLNDTDPQNDTLSARLVSPPQRGTLTLHASGSFTYTPSRDFNGVDTFRYQADDGQLLSNIATVTLTVTPVNDPPVAVTDSYEAVSGRTLTVPPAGVLTNDVDVDGDPLTAEVATPPANGSVSLNPNGGFTYTSNQGFVGQDSFAYVAKDATSQSSPATVLIQVGSADVFYYMSPIGGSWTSAHDWTPTGYPVNPGERAVVPVLGGNPYTLTMNVTPTLDSLQLLDSRTSLDLAGRTLTLLDDGVGLDNAAAIYSGGAARIVGFVRNAATGTISASWGTVLTIDSARVQNDGAVRVNAEGFGADTALHFAQSTVLDGGGLIRLYKEGAWSILSAAPGATLTQEAAHSIRGRGEVRAAMTNKGTIAADDPNHHLSLIQNDKANEGLMVALAGPGLRISGIEVPQSTEGTIEARSANVSLWGGVSVRGGVFKAQPGFGVYTGNGTNVLDSIRNEGDLRIVGGSALIVQGSTFTNDGTVHVNENDWGADTWLRFDDATTVTGPGTILMRKEGNWSHLSTGPSGLITHAAGHTIRGRGIIYAKLLNQGTVTADNPLHELWLTGEDKTNEALMNAMAGPGLRVSGIRLTQGPSGRLHADGASIGVRAGSHIVGGTLDSSGPFAVFFYEGGGTLENGTNLGRLDVVGGSPLNLRGSSLVNSGTLQINSNDWGSDTALNVLEDLLISGAGTIAMRKENNWSQLTTAPGVTVTQSAGHTIRGRGVVSGKLVNRGTISADSPFHELWLTGEDKVNESLMNALSAPGLRISGINVTQTAGASIVAQNGGVGVRAGATIAGGTIDSANGNALFFYEGGGTLDDSTNRGVVDVIGGSTLTVKGASLVNSGTIRINANENGLDTIMSVANSMSLSGSGTIDMRKENNWSQLTTAPGATLTQEAGHTIRGRGMLYASLINFGEIVASHGGHPLWLAGSNKTNNGVMKASTNPGLGVTGIRLDQGPNGVISAEGGNVEVRSNASIVGGKLDSAAANAFWFTSGATSLESVTNQARLETAGGSTVTVRGPVFANSGLVRVNGNDQGIDTVLVFDGPVSLEGTGTIEMRKEGNWSQLNTTAGGQVTQAQGHTIRGRGTIRAKLINNGDVLADSPFHPLELLAESKTNNGLMRALQPPGLYVSTIRLTQGANGVLSAQEGPVVLRADAIVEGGTFTSANDNAVVVMQGSATIDGVTNQGRVDIEGGNALTVTGATFLCPGTVRVNSNDWGADTTLSFPGDTTLTGGGSIEMRKEGNWSRFVIAEGKTLTVDTGFRVHGRGVVSGALVNRGIVHASSTFHPLNLFLAGSGMTNHGELGSAAGCGLVVTATSTLNNRGTLKVDGWASLQGGDFTQSFADAVMRVDGSIGTPHGITRLQGGSLLGIGRMDNLVQNTGGIVAPGTPHAPVGRLTFGAGYQQSGPGRMAIQALSQTIGDYDDLSITGAATLGGTLEIEAIAGYVPQVGHSFTVLNATSVSGAFEHVVLVGFPADRTVSVDYQSNRVVVTVVAADPLFSPEAFAIPFGRYLSGGLPELQSSDDQKLLVEQRAPPFLTAPSIELQIVSTAPANAPSSLSFVAETRSTGHPTLQRMELWDYQSGAWVRVDERRSPGSDTTHTVLVTQNAQRFVDPTTREVKARVRYFDRGAPFPAWRGEFDLIGWRTAP